MNIRVFPWLLFLAISGPLILGMKNNNPDEHQKFESGESSSHGQNMTKLAEQFEQEIDIDPKHSGNKKSLAIPPEEYHFDADGHWVDQEANPFQFVNQEHYERMGAKMNEDLYGLLCQSPCSLRKVNLRGEDHVEKEDSFVFISPNFETADNLVVLINGSGAVRAGQWSRKLIVNESLDVGSQIPYIRRCIAQGWAVLVMNTNDNTYLDEQQGEEQFKEGSWYAIEHGQTVWKQLVVARSPARRIALVAHSYGGRVVAEMLEAEKDAAQLARVHAICLTDSGIGRNMDRTFRKLMRENEHLVIRNWVRSDPVLAPLDAKTSKCGILTSAGTKEHERVSSWVIESVFSLIVEQFNEEPNDDLDDDDD